MKYTISIDDMIDMRMDKVLNGNNIYCLIEKRSSLKRRIELGPPMVIYLKKFKGVKEDDYPKFYLSGNLTGKPEGISIYIQLVSDKSDGKMEKVFSENFDLNLIDSDPNFVINLIEKFVNNYILTNKNLFTVI